MTLKAAFADGRVTQHRQTSPPSTQDQALGFATTHCTAPAPFPSHITTSELCPLTWASPRRRGRPGSRGCRPAAGGIRHRAAAGRGEARSLRTAAPAASTAAPAAGAGSRCSSGPGTRPAAGTGTRSAERTPSGACWSSTR